MNNFYYIAEISLPSRSAYAVHVLKMCDAFASSGYKVNLILLNKDPNLSEDSIKKYYNLKKNISIFSFLKKKNEYSFFDRILFAIKIVFFFKKKGKKNFILSRSILSAIINSFFQKKIILEIHHNLNGFTKVLFKLNNFFFNNIFLYIFIHRNLLPFFNYSKKNYLILDDGVDISDFKNQNLSVIKNTCVYVGGFTKGKGIENIIKIASLLKNINFHLYGDLQNSHINQKDILKYKNIFFKGHLSYNKIPSVLNRYHILLMPYSRKVYVRSSNLETGRFMSPLKLFEYLAAGKIIIASNLEVYKHVLNKKNSILIDSDDFKKWAKKINYVFSNINNFNLMRKESYNTAKKYTWFFRAQKIVDYYNNN
jgi:hypothetical protein